MTKKLLGLAGATLIVAGCATDISDKLPEEFGSLEHKVQKYLVRADNSDIPKFYQQAIDFVEDPKLKKQIADYAVEELLRDSDPLSFYTFGHLVWAISLEPDQDKKEGLIDSSWEKVENWYKTNNEDYFSELAASFASYCSRKTPDPEKRKRFMNTAIDIYITLAKASRPGLATIYLEYARKLREEVITGGVNPSI